MKTNPIIFLFVLHALGGCAASTVPTGAAPAAVGMHLDHEGAEAIVEALERESLSDAEVDALLRTHGVRAMVDNVTRFIPEVGAPEFRKEIRTFAAEKTGGEHAGMFQLADVWQERARIRDLIGTIRDDESRMVGEALSLLEAYRPDTGPLAIRVHFVAGGVSDGFAFENDPRAFYINLARADGDVHEVKANILHEAYHVMQMVAQQRAGTFTAWITDANVPPVERLLAGTLLEGTATFVADPERLAAGEGNLQEARDRYRRSAQPARIAENFATFDAVLKALREGGMTWQEASAKGFSRSPENEERFYFVGYQMAGAIDRHCGPECIGRLFAEPPVEFFRRYVSLYREHPEIEGRFSAETEDHLAALR